jgi:hypothetical protein
MGNAILTGNLFVGNHLRQMLGDGGDLPSVDEAKATAPAQGKGAELQSTEETHAGQVQPTEPQQAKSDTYWQDKITAEQESEGGSSGGGFIPADPPRVETETTYSIFDEPSEKAHKAQIIAHGEIIHRDLGQKSLGMSWLDHALEYAHELDNAIIEIRTYAKYI